MLSTHRKKTAVAKCTDCGKGLCKECADMYEPILCHSCYEKRKSNERSFWVFSLIACIVTFILGYKLNLFEDEWASGYISLSFVTCIVVKEKLFPSKSYYNVIYYRPEHLFFGIIWIGIKILLFIAIGAFITPFVLIYIIISGAINFN